MITTTAAYDTAIDHTDGAGYKTRQIKGRVIFEQVDVGAYSAATATASTTNSISSAALSHDDVRTAAQQYGSFEDGRLDLSGRFVSVPDSGPYANIGWVSSAQCDASGNFFKFGIPIIPPQTMEYTWPSDRSAIGLTIIWDDVSEEYAVNFSVKYYNASSALIETINVTANTNYIWVSNTAVSNYRKIKIEVNSWSEGYRFARIAEVLFGVLVTYEDEQLAELKITEELDISSEELTKNVLEFSINNTDQTYDPINPAGAFTYLQKRQKILSYLGCVLPSTAVEWIPMGVHYLVSWPTARTGEARNKANFTAHDRVELMDVIYRKGVYATDSIGNLLEDVLTEAGLTSADWNIDSALYSINTTTYLPIDTVRNLLHILCIAGMAVCRVDRYNVVQIYQESIDSDVDSITAKRGAEPEINLIPAVYDVIVDYYSYDEAASATQIHKSIVPVSGTIDVWVEYDKPATNGSASLSSGTLNSATYYTKAALLNITGSGDITITVTGKELSAYKTPVTVATGESDGETLSVSVQTISNATQADNVADWLIANAARRNEFKSQWPQNPAVEVGDEVSITSQFGTSTGCTVVQQVFEYTGGLRGTLVARK